ncbi:MAG: reverse transcriptase domain-containing protein [Lachnospiraceae bacterium]|nr:reverse transcriptase domain-containing protein [Lachnospiraceae bacterium]
MIDEAQETNTRLYDRLLDANNLIESFNNSKKDVCWKESVQRYEANLLRNVNHTIKELQDSSYEQKPFYEFPLMERGKRRHVKSLHISDRVINRAVCDYILYPSLQSYLIYDNGASVKGKGIGFTRERLDCHLHKYYSKYGTNEGYILLIDFKKFFDNIDHGTLLKYIGEKIDDDRAMELITYLISTFRVDVSYMTDEEFENCKNEVFNSLRYSNEITKEQQTGEKFMEKSLGIGSQISQISGIFYPTRLDNYCKIVKRCHFYGRYMDDTYVISNSKEYLQQLIIEIVEICDEMGIHVNHKKTQICKLTDFTFLKTKYTLTETGKIIHRMPRDNITRERRKLKTLRVMVDDGRIPYQDARTQYGSWRGNAEHYDAYKTIQSMDELYNGLFIDPFLNGEIPRSTSKKQTKSHKINGSLHRGSNKNYS